MYLTKSYILQDNDLEMNFPIIGLTIEPNSNLPTVGHHGIEITKTASSDGPLISDFVTHESKFEYSSYGIHIGQDDRLTFFGPKKDKLLIGYFIDCRFGSPTRGNKVVIQYHPSAKRKFIIPRGVAHSFDNLEHIVTRDEPIWFTDDANPDWDINNDIVSFLRKEESQFPTVKVNHLQLPFEGHILFSRMQQSLLQEARAYALRSKHKDSYFYHENDWLDKANTSQEEFNIVQSFGIPDLLIKKNSYALTGKNSFTIVPSTTSCISDVVEIYFQNKNEHYWLHRRQKIFLTFLDREKDKIFIEFCDLKKTIKDRTRKNKYSFICDPRFRIEIPAGVAYKMNGVGRFIIRIESELFVSENESQENLPLIGNDLTFLHEENILSQEAILVAQVKCPDEALWLLAKEEITTIKSMV